MFKATLKNLFAHKLRLALTALSIVLGVAFVSGTYVLSDTIEKSFDELFGDIFAGIDLGARNEASFLSDFGGGAERELVGEHILPLIRDVEGVARAEGDVQGLTRIIDKQGRAIVPSGPPPLAVVFGTELEQQPLRIRSGRPPVGSSEMAMDVVTSDNHGFKLGDRVRVVSASGPREFTMVGIVGFGSSDGLGATLAVFDVPTAQQVLGRPDGYDQILVQTDTGADVAEVKARLEALLPAEMEVLTGAELSDEQVNQVGEFLGFLSTALLVFAGIALFVGAFIIVNTFNILVAQRTRELALLRALGASRRQVMTSVVVESLAVGLFASVVGLVAGLGVAVAIQGLFKVIGFDLPATGTVFLPRTVLVALVVGVGVTFVAALLPGRRAASVPPVAALSAETWTPPPASLRRRAIVGGLLVTNGVLDLALGLFGSTGVGLQLVGAGAVSLFLGVATISPLLARPISRFLGRPFVRWRGLPGRLGRENAMRNPRRTAATAGALMVGLAVVGAVSVLASSVKASAGGAVDRAFGADFVVADAFFGVHSPETAERFRQVPGVALVADQRFGEVKIDGDKTFIAGMDPNLLDRVITLEFVAGELPSTLANAIMLSEELAEHHSLAVGETVAIEFPAAGVQTLVVRGIFEHNDLVGEGVISLDAYERNYRDNENFRTYVTLDNSTDAAAARRDLEAVLKEFPGPELFDQTEFKAQQERQINLLLGLIFALLALAILIAFFGIVNTLALSVYERTREIGLLRAVGMSRRQIRRTIRYEAVIIAVMGALLGLALGVLLGTALVSALNDEGITELRVPVGLLAVFIGLAGLAGVVAAALPARRAARLNVLAAISHS